MNRQEVYLFYLNKAFDERESLDRVNERGGGISKAVGVCVCAEDECVIYLMSFGQLSVAGL
jgi:hypothetical protein